MRSLILKKWMYLSFALRGNIVEKTPRGAWGSYTYDLKNPEKSLSTAYYWEGRDRFALGSPGIRAAKIKGNERRKRRGGKENSSKVQSFVKDHLNTPECAQENKQASVKGPTIA